MTSLAKRSILHLLNRAGYRVLKSADHDTLLLRATQTGPLEPAPPAPVVESTPTATCAGSGPAKGELHLLRLLKDAQGLRELPSLRTFALCSAARYLTKARVPGDIVDCGYGQPASLAVLAAALLQLGDADRRLVLFDSTADPLHRAEPELEMWGSDRDLLLGTRHPRVVKPEPAPPELDITSYPADKISIRRYPREAIAYSERIAFLGLTTSTYEANRTAVATFLPRLSRGGVLAVETDVYGRIKEDAVAEYLESMGVNLLLIQVSDNYRIGIKP